MRHKISGCSILAQGALPKKELEKAINDFLIK